MARGGLHREHLPKVLEALEGFLTEAGDFPLDLLAGLLLKVS